MKISMILTSFLFISLGAFAASEFSLPGKDVERELNEAIESAVGETIIHLPEGKFYFQNELLITKAGITIKGTGLESTILSFKNQKAGAQGVLATKDRFRLEGLTIEDTAGNGVKVFGSNNVQLVNLRVRWSAKRSPENGAYGLYPVLSKNILIENCEVSDASDAGIYVGQSTGILVRGNHAHHNVAGIEIENSDDADVVQNRTHDNTAGILVFNLPDLVKKDGKGTYIHDNDIYSNNGKNFSTKGSIINLVPKGMGYFSLASQKTEISFNRFRDHNIAHIGVSNYYVSERPVKDPAYDPMPKGVNIHSNTFGRSKFRLPDSNQTSIIIKLLAGPMSHDIVYDGIDDGTYSGSKPKPEDKICIGKNTSEGKFRFANLHLDHNRPYFPIPGKATRSLEDHQCELPAVKPPAIDLNAGEILESAQPDPVETRRVCALRSDQDINRFALEFDCPELADYQLFEDPKNPRANPRRGFKYELSNELFTDYAMKDRFIFLPNGESMNFRPDFAFEFPVGTVISKTFSLKKSDQTTPQIVETRLLIRRKSGWVPLNYVWDGRGIARLDRAGFVFPTKVVTTSGSEINIDYHVPGLRQCASCHSVNGRMVPLGPRAKFLNYKNQLETWAESGKLRNLPAHQNLPVLPVWTDETASVDLRAKAYLEINCSHCHNPVGNASNTGLFLSSERASTSVEMGHCKTPVAAGFATGGNKYDITPGAAEKSILYFRMQQNHLAVKMPQLGRSVFHAEGNALIKRWVDGMAKVDCVK